MTSRAPMILGAVALVIASCTSPSDARRRQLRRATHRHSARPRVRSSKPRCCLSSTTPPMPTPGFTATSAVKLGRSCASGNPNGELVLAVRPEGALAEPRRRRPVLRVARATQRRKVHRGSSRCIPRGRLPRGGKRLRRDGAGSDRQLHPRHPAEPAITAPQLAADEEEAAGVRRRSERCSWSSWER